MLYKWRKVISDKRRRSGGSGLQMVNDKKKPRGGGAVNSGPIWYLADMLNPSRTVKFENFEIHHVHFPKRDFTFKKISRSVLTFQKSSWLPKSSSHRNNAQSTLFFFTSSYSRFRQADSFLPICSQKAGIFDDWKCNFKKTQKWILLKTAIQCV